MLYVLSEPKGISDPNLIKIVRPVFSYKNNNRIWEFLAKKCFDFKSPSLAFLLDYWPSWYVFRGFGGVFYIDRVVFFSSAA